MRASTKVRASTGVRWSSAGLPTSGYQRDHINHSGANAGETRSARPSHPAFVCPDHVSRSGKTRLGCRRSRVDFWSLVAREFLNQRRQEALNLSIGVAQRLDSLDCVADCRVIPAVVEPADPRRAPPSDSVGQVHGNLSMERCRLSIATNPGWPQPGAHHGINPCQGDSVPTRPGGRQHIVRHLFLRIPCFESTSSSFVTHLEMGLSAAAGPNSRCCPFAETVAGHSGQYNFTSSNHRRILSLNFRSRS
jgi:hypothetical protein